MAEIVTNDGEIIETLPQVTDPNALATILRAELDTQITTAKAYPRSVTQARDDILSLATLDEQTAAECIYALPRGSKPIRGPSIRLAEIIAQQWGNNRVDARVIAIDRANKTITAEGFFHDLEKNAATKRSISRRISDKRGRLFSDDMIVVTGNAACAIAMRNAILAGVPKGIWRRAYEAAEQVVAGDIKTLAVRREAAIKAFAQFGVKPEQIFAVLEVGGLDDIGLEHIPTLLGMYSALKNGEETVETMFDPRRASAPFAAVKNPLKDDESGDNPPVKELTPEPAPDSGPADESETETERPSIEPQRPAAATPFVDPIRAAEQRGRADRDKGMGLKDIPREWNTNEKSALRAAWIKGWQEGAQ